MTHQGGEQCVASLHDKVCVVTGSGSGMGRSNTVEMARRGAKIVVSDINDKLGEETVELVAGVGGEAIYVHCDVRDELEVERLMAQAASHFGGIDVLNNNAGIHDTQVTDDTGIENLSLEAWTAIYEVNLRGTWFATKFAARYLRESKRGPNVVNAGSNGSFVAYPKGVAYNATKGAVLQLTRSTALDLGPHVRANCYCPGTVQTPMIADWIADEANRYSAERTQIQQRIAEPIEISNLVCFLASDEASFITGAMILADGGSLAWRGVH